MSIEVPIPSNLLSSTSAAESGQSRSRIISRPQSAVNLTLLDVFDRIAIISPVGSENEDQANRALRALSLDRIPGLIEFIPEVPLTRPMGWANQAAGNLFMTHYSVINQALDRGWNSVMLWDDSADFVEGLAGHQSEIIHSLVATNWDVVLLGYRDTGRLPKQSAHDSQLLVRIDYDAFSCVTAYAVGSRFLPELAAAMEQVLEHPLLLASPMYPTASAFEPNALSMVLSKVLRLRRDFACFCARDGGRREPRS